MMKMKNKKAEKCCIQCGRIIVDKNNKTGVCQKCTKKDVAAGVAVAAVAPGVVAGVKKYGKQIVQLAKLVLKR